MPKTGHSRRFFCDDLRFLAGVYFFNSSCRYDGAILCRHWKVSKKYFNEIRDLTGNQCSCCKTGVILPTFDTLIRCSGHYNAWKVSTWSLPVRIEMLQLMNRGVCAITKDKALGWQAIVHKQCLPPPPPMLCIFQMDRRLCLWIKWVLKFLSLWSDEINHSNFENATKCLNKSWWYLLKHACFILQLKDFCNTCVHFQWKKTNPSRHIGILSALRMCGLHDKRQLLAKLCIAGSANWWVFPSTRY